VSVFPGRFKGRTAVVTGAASGIGRDVVRHLLAEGARVSLWDVDACACRKLNPAILVMQSAQGWATKNVPGAIDGARDRRIFLQG
jgi:NAD(P)-dependent dehydrogenase (short-subunit alcohol dehydrogenase family)